MKQLRLLCCACSVTARLFFRAFGYPDLRSTTMILMAALCLFLSVIFVGVGVVSVFNDEIRGFILIAAAVLPLLFLPRFAVCAMVDAIPLEELIWVSARSLYMGHDKVLAFVMTNKHLGISADDYQLLRSRKPGDWFQESVMQADEKLIHELFWALYQKMLVEEIC